MYSTSGAHHSELAIGSVLSDGSSNMSVVSSPFSNIFKGSVINRESSNTMLNIDMSNHLTDMPK